MSHKCAINQIINRNLVSSSEHTTISTSGINNVRIGTLTLASNIYVKHDRPTLNEYMSLENVSTSIFQRPSILQGSYQPLFTESVHLTL
jgi:hypothetical protein